MQYKIINNCVNCGACLIVCPVNAVSKYNANNKKIRTENVQFFIVADNCNDCSGYSDVPLCIDICPMDSIKKSRH